jgi:hypothetical protein
MEYNVVLPKIFRLMQNEKMPFSIIDFYLSICAEEKIITCQQFDLEMIDVGIVERLNFIVH